MRLNGELDLLANVHHEVGKLVDDDDDIGQLRRQARRRAVSPASFAAASLARLHLRVVLADVARAQPSRTPSGDAPFQRRPTRSALAASLRFGHDGHVEMRDAVIGGEFDALRVDHDEAHLGGRCAHEDRHDHRVDGNRLTGTGGAADKQVGHLRKIGNDAMAFDILADGDLQRSAIGVFEHIAKIAPFWRVRLGTSMPT